MQLQLNQLTEQVIGAAIQVHRTLGPGLLESVYHQCMEIELTKRQVPFLSHHKLPIVYDGTVVDDPFEMDFYFPQQLVLEIKAVTEIHPIFKATLLTYLRLSNTHHGLLINFHVPLLKEGIIRMAL